MMSPTDRHPDATNTPQRTTSLNQAPRRPAHSPVEPAAPARRDQLVGGNIEQRVRAVPARSGPRSAAELCPLLWRGLHVASGPIDMRRSPGRGAFAVAETVSRLHRCWVRHGDHVRVFGRAVRQRITGIGPPLRSAPIAGPLARLWPPRTRPRLSFCAPWHALPRVARTVVFRCRVHRLIGATAAWSGGGRFAHHQTAAQASCLPDMRH